MIEFENGNCFSYDMIGEFHSSGDWIHPRRTIESFELILILDGIVYIAEEERKYELSKNQLIILEPDKEHYGYKSVSEPTSFFWFHFFTNICIPFKTFGGNNVHEIKQLLKKLLHISNTPGYSKASVDSMGYVIFDELMHISNTESVPYSVLSSGITEYIRRNINKCFSVSDIAHSLGYNADYIGKHFKKLYGIGLKEYIAAQKIRYAKDFLLTTDMNIKQIAHELGYQSENLFIKFFIYHEKISPAAFKLKYCNTHLNSQ